MHDIACVSGAGCGGLGLSQQQVVLSNAMSVSGAILVRICIGAIADQVGVRWSYIVLLVFVSIPGFCVAGKQYKTSLCSHCVTAITAISPCKQKGGFKKWLAQ